MSLSLISICGIILSPLTEPATSLSSLYESHYGCTPEIIEKYDGDLVKPKNLTSYFPSKKTLWPIFTEEQIESQEYNKLIKTGVKPGIILPADSLSLLEPSKYFLYRNAMKNGAIPVLTMSTNNPKGYAARATFASAIGVRPLAALVEDGWSENLLALPVGSYLVDHRQTTENRSLPLPPRENQIGSSYFYFTDKSSALGGGYSIIINPSSTEILKSDIQYPKLGISWDYGDSVYKSSLEGLETSFKGHLMAVVTLISVPIGLFFSRPWPDILVLLGTSLSWGSIFIGGSLMLLLSIAAVRRLRRS